MPLPDLPGDPPRAASGRDGRDARSRRSSRTPSTSRPRGRSDWPRAAHCLREGRPFTTAYHTAFPEYVHARIRLPVGSTYAWLRRFHAPATARHGGHAGIRAAPRRARLRQPRRSGRAASTPTCFGRASDGVGRGPPAGLPLRRPRRGREEHRGLPRARPARHQGGGRRRPAAGRAASGATPTRSSSAEDRARTLAWHYRQADVFVFPEPHRHLRPRAAGGDGLRHAGGGLSR